MPPKAQFFWKTLLTILVLGCPVGAAYLIITQNSLNVDPELIKFLLGLLIVLGVFALLALLATIICAIWETNFS